MELLCENSQRPKHVDYFCKKAPPQMFHWIPNTPLIGGTVNVGVGRLQVHGICNHRLVYWEVIEAVDLYLNWF